MVFPNPQAPNIMVWTLLCLDSNFLRKSILAGCVDGLRVHPRCDNAHNCFEQHLGDDETLI